MSTAPSVAGPVQVWQAAPPPSFAAPLRAVDRFTCHRDEVDLVAVAEFTVPPGALRGHFPGTPILPGVYLLEMLVQTVALVAPAARLGRLRSVRFHAPVGSGDTVRLTGRLRTEPGGGWQVRATVQQVRPRVDGQQPERVATFTATFTAGIGPPEANPAGTPEHDVVDGQHPIALDQAEVRARLPHRHPLLLVDRVAALYPGSRIIAEKAVTATEPCYHDLSDAAAPQGGGYPASLVLESVGQTAALSWLEGDLRHGRQTPGVLMFAAARDFLVLGEARPGDVLRHVVEITYVKAATAFATGTVWAGDRPIASIKELVAVRRPLPLNQQRGDNAPGRQEERQ